MAIISLRIAPTRRHGPLALCITAAAFALAACGGGSSVTNADPAGAAPLASATTTLTAQAPALAGQAGAQAALPSFHSAPVLLDAPDDGDADDNAASAARAAHTDEVPPQMRALPTRGLTLEALEAAQSEGNAGAPGAAVQQGNAPAGGTSTVATYTPAQIRAAYALPALPAVGATASALQAAQMGAGQTIYIVDAMSDPNVVAELAAFNQKFGLPACTTRAIAPSAPLPLAAAAVTGCEFFLVYASAAGAMTASAPAYDAGWATEIALDVQWAHATAPMARIVLIEAPDASLNSLLAAVGLANSMGPGIVSMSFGSAEGNWTASVDSVFTGSNMSYLAATGDSGTGVQWPAVSTHVLAVGGTSLSYSGIGARSESAWSSTGGGISSYTAVPGYQNSSVPGMGGPGGRSVADVSFNADPYTGQYVAVIAPGSSTPSWLSAGGTSLSTPQWAGLLATVNALRAQSAKPALGAPHTVLYDQIAATPGTYASSFADITSGADGSCSVCSAKLGYDTPTGLGTPNVSALLASLSGTAGLASAPIVTGATVSGQAGTALSFSVNVSASNPLTFALSGAPSGMSVNASGTVTWAAPVAGNYSVAIKATDSKSGLSGSATYTVVITAPPPPSVASGTISGKVASALSFSVAITCPDPVTISLSGAPSGMTISSSGLVSWPSPLAGTYTVTVSAKDGKTGLSGRGVFVISIAAQTPPVVTGAAINGIAGTPLSFSVLVSASNPLNYALSGAPAGMSISASGVVSWASPLAGSYSVTVSAKDSKTGLSGQGIYTVKIAAAGLVINAPTMTGVAGKSLSGTIAIADPGASYLSISISGVPLGMTFSLSGFNVNVQWASPVAGQYSLKVSVTDSAGHSAQASVPVTITAH